jgi:alanyl-tRNA synthetase
MKSIEIRKKFFNFFEKQGHTLVKSSSLIPAQDPTLLFTNAGMNQFKDVFLGLEKRSYTRAVSIQKCVRAGGKHNDLDNVGFTKRHLTFFEMMGNFSFGDYFKKDAIIFAWNFLTKEMNLPVEKLHASVFETDDDAYDIWLNEIGLPAERIHRLGAQDNFWQMGDTGPCGPCSEIYIDRGASYGSELFGDQSSSERYLEIWNLVFMQYDRQANGMDKPLTYPGVDTGMGLERLTAVMQNKDSIFQTDLFEKIIFHIEEATGLIYSQQQPLIQAAFHVLADHIRSSSLIIADGASPSNEGRGYVLRKIIRRAALFAQKLTEKNIFPGLSRAFINEMAAVYPELQEQAELIYRVLYAEIDKFAANLIRGQALLRSYVTEHITEKIIPGSQAFKLYDTFGFPLELIHVMAQENNFIVDLDGFHQCMAQQKESSGKKIKNETTLTIDLDPTIITQFTGYDELETLSKVSALIVDNQLVTTASANQDCWVIVEKSPFFIVGGGQVPDQGYLLFEDIKIRINYVCYIGNAIGVQIHTPINLKVGMVTTSVVDKPRRINAMKNHTATHLLQAALMKACGKQIKQSGSLVHPDYLRFDFTYHENLDSEMLKTIENIVNQKIQDNIPVVVEHTTLKDASNRGVIAFFGDKYNPDNVRIVQVADFSAELCGGTHVKSTGEIGSFKIVESTSLAAGHRRIVAVTGPEAITLFQGSFDTVKCLSQLFKIKREDVWDTIQKQQLQLKNSLTTIRNLKEQLITLQIPEWLQHIKTVNNIPVLYIEVSSLFQEFLPEIAHKLIAQHPGLYCIVAKNNETISFYIQASTNIKNMLNTKRFASLLQTEYNLKCSASTEGIIRGGGVAFDNNAITTILNKIM